MQTYLSLRRLPMLAETVFHSDRRKVNITQWYKVLPTMQTFYEDCCSVIMNTVILRYLEIEVHPKLLICQSKFSGPQKITLRYQYFEIKGVEIKMRSVSKLYSLI